MTKRRYLVGCAFGCFLLVLPGVMAQTLQVINGEGHSATITAAQIAALRTGTTTGDTKIDALTRVVKEAAANSGNVTDVPWKAAQQGGWSDAQLAEAFAYLGLTVFTGYFLNYAQTDPDV